METLQITYPDATTLVARARQCLGVRFGANDRDLDRALLREAKRIHRVQAISPANTARRWKRATVTPL